MKKNTTAREEKRYNISEASRAVGLHPQTLRNYEDLGLVVPRRSRGNFRLYTERDVERLRKIVRLTNDLGVNLAGVAIILDLTERVETLLGEVAALRAQMTVLITADGSEPSDADEPE